MRTQRRWFAVMFSVACLAGLLPFNDLSGRLQADDATAPGTGKKEEKVKAEAHLSLNKLAAGRECQILIRLKVQEGWHVNSNPTRPKGLPATEVLFKGKLGTKLTDVRYPPGHLISLQGFEEKVSVYDGQVDIFGKLVVPVEAAGQVEDMEIVIRYQACDDRECLIPTSIKLNGRLPVAAPGEAVRAVNEKLFAEKPL